MKNKKGFTLIETLVAIALLSVAIVAPMSLTVQSLGTAYYARDQITAFYLAQEAIEALRSIRDGRILCIAQGDPLCTNTDIFGPIPRGNQAFIIDARKGDPGAELPTCNGACPLLQTDGILYGYPGDDEDTSLWTPTHFTRTVRATFVGGGQDEIRVTVTVEWKTERIQTRSFSISENLYRWVEDGSARE